MVQVRQATEADLDTVVETVSQAFVADPAWDFMIGPGNTEGTRLFARALFVPRARAGTAWVADDGLAVALWDRADRAPERDVDGWWRQFRRDAGEDVWRRLQTYDDALEAVGPARPFWYLGVLATHPSAQGRGLATAVLQPAFEAAARDGWDCWLETSKPGNKTFYAGRGFTEPIEVDVPGGPRTWWLGRRHTSA